MALIKCTECGKEINDKAEMCPNCGCPISESIFIDTDEKNDKNKEEIVNTEYDRKKNTRLNMVGTIDDNKKKRKIKHLLFITFIITVVIFIMLYLCFCARKNYFYNGEKTGEDNEKTTISFCEELLGKKFDKDGNISLGITDKKHMESSVVFGMRGNVSLPTYGKSYVSHVKFTSEEQFENEEYISILHEVEKTYGEHKGVDNIKYNHELQSIFSWETSEFDVWCQRDEKHIVSISWIKNSNDNIKQEQSEEFKIYTEYEGKYNKKAEKYKSYADACFLEKLNEEEQTFSEEGGIAHPDWKLSGTFLKGKNYYFYYKSFMYSSDVGSHTLIEYDINSGEASDVTPLEWLEADIDAAERKINGD